MQYKDMEQKIAYGEHNVRAVKDTGTFGGPNMWRLEILTTNGTWESVQWMHVHNVQSFVNEKLPVYEEPSSNEEASAPPVVNK